MIVKKRLTIFYHFSILLQRYKKGYIYLEDNKGVQYAQCIHAFFNQKNKQPLSNTLSNDSVKNNIFYQQNRLNFIKLSSQKKKKMMHYQTRYLIFKCPPPPKEITTLYIFFLNLHVS